MLGAFCVCVPIFFLGVFFSSLNKTMAVMKLFELKGIPA